LQGVTGSTVSLGHARDASAAGFEALFARYEPRVARFLAQVVRDREAAGDLLQETFLTAYRERAALAAHPNPEAWLLRTARHRALAHLRRQRRRQAVLERLGRRPRPAVDEPAALSDLQDLLERTLSPEDRLLVVVRYVHDLDASLLGEIFELSPEAVRQRLSRARRRLAAGLDERREP
jgi:RNA polymerase sigma-70 factor (ECF subfamily)